MCVFGVGYKSEPLNVDVALGIWCANWEMGCEALGIQGHFALLSSAERGIHDEQARPQLPKYDVSWIVDENF
jgi:hypothetical protein